MPQVGRFSKSFSLNPLKCTVADTCHILVFSGISNAKIQGGANIRDAFETLAKRFKYYNRVLNIRNTFETFGTSLKH